MFLLRDHDLSGSRQRGDRRSMTDVLRLYWRSSNWSPSTTVVRMLRAVILRDTMLGSLAQLPGALTKLLLQVTAAL